LDVGVYYSINIINSIDMKRLFSWASGFVSDNGEASSKRLVGIVCSGFLCWTMYANSFTEEHFAPSAVLVQAVAALAFGCLGLTSAEKIFKKEKTD
jgi:hypothetical protein